MTECIKPDEIVEGDLLAYIDGEASEVVHAHIAACPFCAARATRLQRMERTLMQKFYRAGCPSPEILGQYQLELLEATEKMRIAAHLRDCSHCRREIAALESNIKGLDSLANMALQLIQKAFKVADATLIDPGNLAPAGIRGQTEARPRAYHTEGLDILIGYQVGVSPPTGTLLGAIVQTESVTGSQVWLLREGEKPACSQVDTLGTFTFDSIPPGEYDLALEAGDTAILLRQIII